MILILLLVLSVLSLVVTYQWLANYLRMRNMLATVPGPKQYPILGISLLLRGVLDEDRLTWFDDLCYRFKNGMVLFWVGCEPFIAVRKPHQLQAILTSNTLIKKSRSYEFLRPWLGEGLITSTGKTWFYHRRLITPAFHFGVLEEYAAVMRDNVESLINNIDAECQKNEKNPIDVFDIIGRYTLDTICETAMGVNVNAQQQTNNEYCQALYNVAHLLADRTFKFWLQPDFIYYRTKNGKKFLENIKIMCDFTEKIIVAKQKNRSERKTSNVEEIKEENDFYGKRKRKPKAFLDLLLDANENAESPLSVAELREEVNTFIFAGQDTTAMGISNILFVLGNAPEVQAKIHEELKEVFGDSNDVATTQQLDQLKYLGRVIKESLRIYPSVAVISRKLENDIVLDNHPIPKDSILRLCIHQLHHDPETWTDPDKFDPDRFLPENSKNRHPYAYIPFSAGPRNCIGQKFAYLELKTALTAILRKWKVRSVLKRSEVKRVINITLRPADGKVELYFTPIDEQ